MLGVVGPTSPGEFGGNESVPVNDEKCLSHAGTPGNRPEDGLGRIRKYGDMMRLLFAFLLLAACSGTPAETTAIEISTTTAAPSTTTTVPSTSTLTSLSPTTSLSTTTAPSTVTEITEYPVTPGSHPHDVAPATDGTVWYTGQGNGTLGRLDPSTGEVTEVDLGPGSAPHGVITGPDGLPWVTDSGLNALVRVDPDTGEVTEFELPGANVNLNTAVFTPDGTLWFTGQAGFYGSLDPGTGEITVFDAPGGRGPYGITVTPDGDVFYASLAGSHIAQIDPVSGGARSSNRPQRDRERGGSGPTRRGSSG